MVTMLDALARSADRIFSSLDRPAEGGALSQYVASLGETGGGTEPPRGRRAAVPKILPPLGSAWSKNERTAESFSKYNEADW